MDEPRPGDPVERLAHRPLDSDAVDLAHREDPHARLAEQLPLAVVELSEPEQRDAPRIDRGERPGVARERLAGEPERSRERHPVHVSARARLGRVDVGVRVDPEHAARPVHRREPTERPERDRVVAAEDERNRSGT